VIADVLAYERCMKCLFATATANNNVAYDFAGITSSHEGVYHLQSYFMLFNTSDVIKAVVNYFDVNGLPINHNASISVYELGITPHLISQGFNPYAMVSNSEMQFPLNTTYYKWSAVLQHAGIIKRQHLLKQYPVRYAMTDYNIALVANKFSENKHFIHYLNYHGIKLD
jgi:lipopolysaccharide biosynthesis protein